MCFSVFSGTVVEVAALGAADKMFTVKSSMVTDGKITYTVSLSGGIEGFGGAVILVEYDNAVLSPVEFLPAYTSSGVQQFKGVYVNGISAEYDNFYSVGYTNTTPEKVSANTEFFKLTFEVISEERPTTDVNFYCKEFFSTTDSEQSITVADGLQTIAKIANVVTLEAPKLESATLLTNAITFKWKEAIGATRYEIRRKTPIGTWNVIATVSADNLTYTDVNLESGNTYIYSVKALNDYGSSMFDSNGVSCQYISKPSGITAVNGVGGIDISWEATNGVDKYQVVRRELGETDWTIISERSATLTTFYKDTTAENGKTYEYDVNSVLGSFITDALEEGQIVTYLPSPEVNSVTNISEGIELKWASVENAAYYIVYRKCVSDGEEFSAYATTVTGYFVDTEVIAGKAYSYSVQAISNYGSESAFTKTGYTLTRVSATTVTGLTAQADNIKVYWNAVEGIDGYYIYRKAEDSDWEKAGNAPKTSTTFEDKGAGSGKTYYYCVAPYIGNSESEKVSSDISVYYLKAPQNVTAVNTKDAIKVSWSASAGTTEYRIFRNHGSITELVALVDAGETEYIDTDVEVDEIYSYYIQAVSSKGQSENSATTSEVMRIECVQGIKTGILANGIKISWKEHPYAEYYVVCRRNAGIWTRISQTYDLDYIDETVVSGEVYAYSVIPVVASFEGGIDESLVKETKFLSAPKITKITNNEGSMTVTWEKVAGAKTYELQRARTDSDGDRITAYSTVATLNADKTSYEDTNVVAGQGYIYRMYAVDGSNKSVVSATYKAVFLTTQKIKSLSNAYGGVKIIWYSSKGAEKYSIYRKESGGDWVLVTKVSSSQTSYTDKGAKNGVSTYYAVRAENGNSISRYKSKSFTYFASPVVEVSNSTSAITVTWPKISGAKSYYIYRKAPGESSWKKVATVTKNIYNDTNVKTGKIYKYTVKAYNGKIFSGYNTSGWSIKRLTAPELKSAKNYTSGITIKWGKVSGASSYNVYRKIKGTSGWVKIATTKSTSYTDKKAVSGKIYIYTVRAVSGSSVSTYIAKGLTIERLTRPSLKTVKSTKKGVKFTWGEVTGASGYYVYRKTGSGDWEQIAKVSGKSTTSYLDKTAKKGKTYYYSVRAYSGSHKSAYNTTGLKIKDKY